MNKSPKKPRGAFLGAVFFVTVSGAGVASAVPSVRVIDNGDPGSSDRFGLRITSPAGFIVADLTFDPITLSGGNFSVPKLTGK